MVIIIPLNFKNEQGAYSTFFRIYFYSILSCVALNDKKYPII